MLSNTKNQFYFNYKLKNKTLSTPSKNYIIKNTHIIFTRQPNAPTQPNGCFFFLVLVVDTHEHHHPKCIELVPKTSEHFPKITPRFVWTELCI